MSEQTPQMMEELTQPQDELTLEDRIRLGLQQEIQRMSAMGDFFVEMTAKTQEIADLAIDVKNEVGEEATRVYPKTDPPITVNEAQEDLIAGVAFSEIEKQSVLIEYRKFLSWLNAEYGPRISLPMAAVPTDNETTLNVFPMLFNYKDFRQAMLTALFLQFISERNEHVRSKIMTLPK